MLQVLGLAIGAAWVGLAVAEVPGNGPHVAVRPIGANVPTLRGAAALATLVALDPKSGEAEFRVGCGWYYKPKRRVRLGLWKVPLRGASFNLESYPNGPASGIAHSVSITTWERQVLLHGWSGTLWFGPGRPYISNGPTTDICGGVLG
ncbi:MAG: hypothetical protein KGL94_05730 [Acidobacteriota bacterium]|nr:hypothetical protein [Acidobacteriota bacterium]